MATKKDNSIYYLIGAGVLAGGIYLLYPKIKEWWQKQKASETDSENLPELPTEQDTQQQQPQIVTNVITPSGVIPTTVPVTNNLSPLGTPKEKLNLNIYLKKGDRGQEVAKLQQLLNKISDYTKKPKVTEDGIFGAGTEARLNSMFGNIEKINLYKIYTALYAIYIVYAQKIKLDKWFNYYQSLLASPVAFANARNLYFQSNPKI